MQVSRIGPNRLHELLETIRAKYLSPLEFWRLYANSDNQLRVLTVNVEMLQLFLKDRRILDQADYCTVDSAVLQTALRCIFAEPFERLTGREIVARSPGYLARRAVCIFGASERSRKLAMSRYQALGAGPGQLFVSDEPISLADSMTAVGGARIAGFFAYGFPKQEGRINAFCELNPGRMAMLIGVGGAIDYFSGTVRCPPEFVARAGFEWLWRLVLQPKLRLRRIAMAVPLALRLLAYGYRRRVGR